MSTPADAPVAPLRGADGSLRCEVDRLVMHRSMKAWRKCLCTGRAMTRLTAAGFLGRPCYRTCPRWWLLMMPIPLFWCRAAPRLSVTCAYRPWVCAVLAVASRRCMFFDACRGVFCGWCRTCLCFRTPRALSGFCLIRGVHLFGFICVLLLYSFEILGAQCWVRPTSRRISFRRV